MKRQILFLIILYIFFFCCIALIRANDDRPVTNAVPIPAPTFIWPSEVFCEAN